MTSKRDSQSSIYRWIERKPLSEAVLWTSREKFWLITATCHYGTHDWKSIAQVVKNAGEAYRPKEGWYTSKNCERQFKIIISNFSKDIKSLPFNDMMEHIAESLKEDYIRDVSKSNDSLKTKYCNLFSIMNRVKQGNLTRNEVVNLYSQARRNEIEGKQYMEQLMTRQNSTLASDIFTSETTDEPIKWNTPSAPLLTSLLRSRNTIPANRSTSTIASLLQNPAGTPRTRSGKLLPLTSSPSVKTTQGTPTLSKLLEAPANPYIQCPSPTQKDKSYAAAGSDKSLGINKKENLQTSSINKKTILDSYTHDENIELRDQISKSLASSNKNETKLMTGEQKIEDRLIEPRATRSQTRADGQNFKQTREEKIVEDKSDQHIKESQNTDELLNEVDIPFDLDSIDVEPLSVIQEKSTPETIHCNKSLNFNQTVHKDVSSTLELENISHLNTSVENENKNLTAVQSQIDDANISECYVPIDNSIIKDTILVRKDNQTFSTTGKNIITYDGQLLKQNKIIEFKGTNFKCVDSKGDSKLISFVNQPIVVVNKIKKPFNIKLSSEIKDSKDKSDVPSSTNVDSKKTTLVESSQNVKHNFSETGLIDDDVIVIDDDSMNMSINEEKSSIKQSSSKSPISNRKNISNILNNDASEIVTSKAKKSSVDSGNGHLIKEFEVDLDPSTSQNSLSNLYNGVEEIVEMHSLDSEDIILECDSVDIHETEVTSVNENNLNSDAFDTFAQNITNNQKLTSSKIINSLNSETHLLKYIKKDNEKLGAIQSNELDVSVTGIPVLQDVISDVMSKIDSNCVEPIKNADSIAQNSTNVIFEISSDDEEIIKNIKQDRKGIISTDSLKLKTEEETNFQNKTKDKKNRESIKVGVMEKDDKSNYEESYVNVKAFENDEMKKETHITVDEIIKPEVRNTIKGVHFGKDAEIKDDEKKLKEPVSLIFEEKGMFESKNTLAEGKLKETENKNNKDIKAKEIEEKLDKTKEIDVKDGKTKILSEVTKQPEEIMRETRRSKIYDSDGKNKNESKLIETESKKHKVEEIKNNIKTRGTKIEEIGITSKQSQTKNNKLLDSFSIDILSSTSISKSSNDDDKAIIDEKTKKDINIISNESSSKTLTRSSTQIKDTKTSEKNKSSLSFNITQLGESETNVQMQDLLDDSKCIQSNESKEDKIYDINVTHNNTNDIQISKEKRLQRTFENQQDALSNSNEVVSKTNDETSQEKLGPKKRGRKRRIDQLVELTSTNREKSISQDGSISENDLSVDNESSAKRTRKSVHFNLDSKENGKEPSDYIEDKKAKKRSLKLLFDNLCQTKYFSMFEKPLKEIPIYKNVIDSPLELKDVKRKIEAEEIKNIDELQINLMLMSFNAIMFNPTNSTVSNDATSLQFELKYNCQLLQGAIEESCSEDEDDEENEDDNENDDELNDSEEGSTTTDDSQPKKKKRKVNSSSDDDVNDDN
ncbi:MATH and LRR domain-containing protein PFE0570w-like isoform X2 [Daktulosphaira vitifoliae]|uniref:MATH and LRR domain-containing protein PFE0570w-like isoform X2 n=1 Tax=Daktulosphaira vitifoliae TaxID=58002 RepID=UPI0021AA12D8|nr:MATH and LRR domain-containing protein PFE0570w-like isoform X2 [Daktulosphaira vitifoliae]